MDGRIKTIVSHRGFGFITAPDSLDYFFHVRDLAADMPFDETLVNREVWFSPDKTERGPRARSIRAAR